MVELAPAHDALSQCTSDWFVCHILAGPGHTEGLATQLSRNENAYYLPTTTVTVKNGLLPDGRQNYRKKQKPLFPGYLFLNGDDAKSTAYDSPHCYQIDDVVKGMQQQLSEELLTIAMALEVRPDLTTGPLYKKGSLVKIFFPHELAGCIGRVNFEAPDGMVYINIRCMNAGIPIPVPLNCVERLDIDDGSVHTGLLFVTCINCGRDTKNVSGFCDRCQQ